MGVDIGRELSAMKRMTVAELRDKFAEVTGEPTRCRHKVHLIRRIAWRLQAEEEGGLSERARQRAADLAKGADVRLTAPRGKPGGDTSLTRVADASSIQEDRLPLPGAILTRVYKGETIEVRVLPKGFEYQGEVYRSLSAVAKRVTGTHWNGYHFFRLGNQSNGKAKR